MQCGRLIAAEVERGCLDAAAMMLRQGNVHHRMRRQWQDSAEQDFALTTVADEQRLQTLE